MDFSSRLNRLMQVMGTNNNRLAMALNLDASLISRWRTGKRTPKKMEGHAKAIAAYYARSAQAQYQKSALMEIMGLELQEAQEDRLTQLLATWLMQGQGSQIPAAYQQERLAQVQSMDVTATLFLQPDAAKLAMERFFSEIQRVDAGDVTLLCPHNMDWVLQTDSYDEVFSALRRVLTSGRCVRMILCAPTHEDRDKAVVAWSRLASYGRFTILEMEQLHSGTVLCLCRHQAVQLMPDRSGQWVHILHKNAQWLDLLQYDAETACGKAKTVLASVPAHEYEGSFHPALRAHFNLSCPREDEHFPGMELLILPRAERWKQFFSCKDPELLRERMEYVQANLNQWAQWIRTHPDRDLRILLNKELHTGHFENMDVEWHGDRILFTESDERAYLTQVTDPLWVKVMQKILVQDQDLCADSGQIEAILYRYGQNLLHLYASAWQIRQDLESDPLQLERREHKGFGACIAYTKGEDRSAQYYRLENDRILILSLSSHEQDARQFLSYLQSAYPAEENNLYLLASLEGEGEATVAQAMDLGFTVTGITAFENGVPCNSISVPTNLRIRVEMKWNPQKE